MKPNAPKPAFGRVLTTPEPKAAERVVTPERLLLEAAERVGRMREGRVAVQIHLSRLQATNREEAHLRIALRMLDPLVSGYRTQVFLLGNKDIVVLGQIPIPDLDAAVYKLRSLFGKDPLTQEDTGDGSDRFSTWFILENDFGRFLETVQDLDMAAEARKIENATRPPPKIEIMTSRHLEAVLATMERADIPRLIRRQAAVRVGAGNTRAEIAFQEFFFSVADVQKTIAPRLDLLSSRWLFQHLTTGLDRMMMVALSRQRVRHRSPVISVNLNLSSLNDSRFKGLLDSLGGGQTMIVEMEVLDALTNLRDYFAACERLRADGHKVAMDRLTPLTLRMIDVTLFQADYLKINWSPDLADTRGGSATSGESAREMIAVAGAERFVLARCDSEAAVKWGLSMGIQWFQGRFVDAMLAAMTMASCKESGACTLQQCVQRREVLSGPARQECTNHQMVDSLPTIRSSGRDQA
ncbi:MAG: hypothetical protein H7840_03745 [Alphaproteobacteria bacterium]